MLKRIAAVVGLLLAALLVLAATKPDTFRVERSVTIDAPPEKIYPLIDDFDRWRDWSPWEKLDPAMRRTRSGAARGTGAVYEWAGNSKVGSGRMEITEAAAPSRVAIDLRFLEPFESRSTAEFTLRPQGRTTTVTWAMHGPSNFMSKLMSVFVSMDGMIGGDFERGLAGIKAIAEA